MDLLDVPDWWECYDPVHDNFQEITLDHYLIYLKEVTRPIFISNHQNSPVEVSVKIKLRATGPLIMDIPQCDHPVPPN